MIHNETTCELFAAGRPARATRDEVGRASSQALNALPIPWVEPVDICNAILFLVSDEARYITGVSCRSTPGRSSSERSTGRSPSGSEPSLATPEPATTRWSPAAGSPATTATRCGPCAPGSPATWSAGPASSTCCWPPSPPAATCCWRGRRARRSRTLLRAITAEWGIPLVFVEGNADLTPDPAGRPPRPGAGAARGLLAGQLRARPAGRGHARGRVPLRRGVQPGARGHPEHAAHRDGRAAGSPCRGSARSRPRRSFRVIASMNPYDNVGHDPAVHLGARPAVPAGDRLPGRRGRAGHRRPAHRRASPRGWSPTPSR